MSGWPWPEADIAWLAGLIEGEGHVGIHVRHRKYRRRDYPLPEIRMRNTDLSLLNAVKSIFGGVVRKVYDAGRSTNLGLSRKAYYEWCPRQSAIRMLAHALEPYMRGEKKKAIQEITNFYRNPEVLERLRHWSHPKE
jgi:hypothetical protein